MASLFLFVLLYKQEQFKQRKMTLQNNMKQTETVKECVIRGQEATPSVKAVKLFTSGDRRFPLRTATFNVSVLETL